MILYCDLWCSFYKSTTISPYIFIIACVHLNGSVMLMILLLFLELTTSRIFLLFSSLVSSITCIFLSLVFHLWYHLLLVFFVSCISLLWLRVDIDVLIPPKRMKVLVESKEGLY